MKWSFQNAGFLSFPSAANPPDHHCCFGVNPAVDPIAPIHHNPCVGILIILIRVVRAANMETPPPQVAVGQTGKILIRGPQVMSGYQNNPEATAAVIDKEGYFDTGALKFIRPESHRHCVCCCCLLSEGAFDSHVQVLVLRATLFELANPKKLKSVPVCIV